jgi:glyoxylase-like metal-dependent hydrolase (beta-lactamase superfamily II)
MAGRRQERQLQQRREILERTLDLLDAGQDVPQLRTQGGLEAVFFHDHADLVQGLAEVLERSGLEEAFQALARHLEEDRDAWLRRLERMEAEPSLRAARAALERDYLAVLATHFGRWGAAGVQGERIAQFEAGLALAALRSAERLWVAGHGRPVLPVLVQEALAVLWPALYGHARRHAPR